MRRFVLVYLGPAILMNLGNACAYLFQLVLARALGPADVGAFNALLALVNILSAAATAVPLGVARAMIELGESRPGALGDLVVQSALAFGAAVGLSGILFAVAVPALGSALRIESSLTLWLAFVFLASSLLYPLATGWLQGRGRYLAMASALGGVSGLRLAFGVCFVVALPWGLDGALLAAALPGFVVFGAGLWAMRALLRTRTEPLPAGSWGRIGRFSGPACVTTILLFAFWNVDVVLVRWLRPDAESGLYAVAAVLARIPLLLPVALANVLFPEAQRASASGDAAARRVLGQGLGLAALLGGSAALVLFVWAAPLLELLAGPAYGPAAPILRVLCPTMAGFGLVQIVVTYGIARERHGTLLPLLLGLLAFGGLAGAFGDDPVRVAQCLAACVALVLPATLAIVLRPGRSEAAPAASPVVQAP